MTSTSVASAVSLINVGIVACELSGIARVLVEPHGACSSRLMLEVVEIVVEALRASAAQEASNSHNQLTINANSVSQRAYSNTRGIANETADAPSILRRALTTIQCQSSQLRTP